MSEERTNSREAFIKAADFSSHKNLVRGDAVGTCNGIIQRVDKCGVVIKVKPHLLRCDRCDLSEYCPFSMALGS